MKTPGSLLCQGPVSQPPNYWRNLNMKKSLIGSVAQTHEQTP